MWGFGKKTTKKSRVKMVGKVKKKMSRLGVQSNRRIKVIKRKVGKLLKRKPKLRRQKGKEKLEEVESVQCS